MVGHWWDPTIEGHLSFGTYMRVNHYEGYLKGIEAKSIRYSLALMATYLLLRLLSRRCEYGI
jgi:hypothetical protein